jgi:beta-glucanase (GH16 family)
MVNTGVSFRQKYGIFTAKIKLGDPASRSAFWLLGEKAAPLITVCRTSGGKVWFDLINNGKSARTKLGARYAGDSFIFTLEWTASSLIWKINGVEVLRQTENVPQEPMYINLAGGVSQPINGMTSMEIDWIRVYQSKN